MENENKTIKPSAPNYYVETRGTGALSSIIFVLICIVAMVIASKFIG